MMDSAKLYDHEFYVDRNKRTRYAADTILSIVAEHTSPIRSAVDLGCGVGTWLSVLKGRGAERVRGYDGPWVDPSLLEIDRAEFQHADLKVPVPLDQKYDLAISLEVAEHLPRSAGPTFVDTLTALADFVLFSAAIPGQGGVGHINEQWQEVWAELFAEKGYQAFDVVRPLIWSDEAIAYPYRQNTVLYVRGSAAPGLRKSVMPVAPAYLSRVHPFVYEAATSTSIKRSLTTLYQAVKRRVLGGPGDA